MADSEACSSNPTVAKRETSSIRGRRGRNLEVLGQGRVSAYIRGAPQFERAAHWYGDIYLDRPGVTVRLGGVEFVSRVAHELARYWNWRHAGFEYPSTSAEKQSSEVRANYLGQAMVGPLYKWQ